MEAPASLLLAMGSIEVFSSYMPITQISNINFNKREDSKIGIPCPHTSSNGIILVAVSRNYRNLYLGGKLVLIIFFIWWVLLHIRIADHRRNPNTGRIEIYLGYHKIYLGAL